MVFSSQFALIRRCSSLTSPVKVVVTYRASGRSKGFWFITYATIEEAERAKEGMNAKFLDGWVIFVDPAKPRQPQPQPQPQQQSSESGFTSNKTIGWCG